MAWGQRYGVGLDLDGGRCGVDGEGGQVGGGGDAVLCHLEHRVVGAVGQVGGLRVRPGAIGLYRDGVVHPVDGDDRGAARRCGAAEFGRGVIGLVVAVLRVGDAVVVVVADRGKFAGGIRDRGAADAVVLHGSSRRTAGTGDGGFNGGVGIGRQFAAGHRDAEGAIGVGFAGVGLAVDHDGHGVVGAEGPGDLAGDVDRAGLLGGAQQVVTGQRVQAEGGLRGRVAALERVVLRGGGGVAVGALDHGFDLRVRISLEVAHGHGHAESSVGVDGGGIDLAIDKDFDQVASGKLPGDLALDLDRAGALLAGAQDVVARQRLQAQRGLNAVVNRFIVVIGRQRRRPDRAGQAQRSEQRVEGQHAQRRTHARDLGAAQRYVGGCGTVHQRPHQTAGARVFGDVFVESAVLGLADHGVVALGQGLVVVLDDQVRGIAAFERDEQVLALAAYLDMVGAQRLLSVKSGLLQLQFHAGLGLQAHRLPFVAGALGHGGDLVVGGLAGAQNDFVLLAHVLALAGGVLKWQSPSAGGMPDCSAQRAGDCGSTPQPGDFDVHAPVERMAADGDRAGLHRAAPDQRLA